MNVGYEEGHVCGRDGCEGVMEINPEGCTCFRAAPCWSCMNSLECQDCGVRTGPDGDVSPVRYYD